jgi:hypothetical protein
VEVFVSESSGPELFTVMPRVELHRALRQSMPPQTRIAWERLGVMDITAGKIGAVDAASLHPRYPSEIYVLAWPHAQAEVWVQRAAAGEQAADRIFAVLLGVSPHVLPKTTAGWTIAEGESMAIDSATAAFGDYARMLSEMRAGGTHGHVCLGRGSAREPQVKQVREEAARFLQQHGFPATIETYPTGAISVRFSPGLTDEQVEQANALLAQTGCTDRVWIAGSHTSGLLAAQLIQSPVTQLSDSRGPYLFACRTGFGDGMYFWDSVWQGDQLYGYLCNFVPAEEEAIDAAD